MKCYVHFIEMQSLNHKYITEWQSGLSLKRLLLFLQLLDRTTHQCTIYMAEDDMEYDDEESEENDSRIFYNVSIQDISFYCEL